MPEPAHRTATAQRRRRRKTVDSASANSLRRSQRERLIDAVTELSTRVGYQQVSIAQISARAGVSSATFYQEFADKEDCLIAAYWAAARRIVGPMQLTGGADFSALTRAALDLLLGELRRHPAAGRVLLVEARAAGPRMRAAREQALELFEQRIEGALESSHPGTETLDIPASMLVGGVSSIAAWRLRGRAEDQLPLLVEDLLTWISSYAVPVERGRWSPGAEASLPIDAAALAVPVLEPVRLPRGRHGLPAGVVARSQRTRIIYGTAEVMLSKGFANATVTDIVSAAAVSREVFYRHFSDRLDAFLEAQRYSTQEVLDACAVAYFSAERWPERVWSCLRTLTDLIVSHPSLSHLRLVECYAAGPVALSRAEDITKSFTLFLEEGYGYRPQAGSLPRVCSQAIAGAIFEVVYRHIARGETAALSGQLPRLAYVALAPFTGPREAIRLVSEMSDSEAHASGQAR